MKVCMVLLIALAVTACGSWLEKADKDKRASEVYVSKGVNYLEAGRYEQARIDLERALDLNSGNSEAHNAMAVLSERLDKQDEARSHYRRAVGLDKHNYGALNNYSRFLCSHGDYEQGVELLDEVLDSQLYSQPWLILTNKGICYKSAGKNQEAEATLRKALDGQREFAPALLELARLGYAAKDYMKTRAFLQRYFAVARHTAETLLMAAKTEEAMGNLPAMRGYLNQLRSQFPESPEAVESRAAEDNPH